MKNRQKLHKAMLMNEMRRNDAAQRTNAGTKVFKTAGRAR